MKGEKKVIRKTISQERFEVLIKKQKAGTATFRDLTELDEIVNRVPDIRLTILEEMENQPVDGDIPQNPISPLPSAQPSLITCIKTALIRLLHFSAVSLPVV